MKFSYLNISLIFFSVLFISSLFAADNENSSHLKKVTTKTNYAKFNINNVSTYIYNNGDADIKPDGNSGFEYPKGSDKYAVFESGFVWGGKVNGKILVGGSTYTQGLQPGRIKEDGTAEDPNTEAVRVFRVRPDYEIADLSSEIEDEGKDESEIRNQYEKDWNEWPAEFGAPYLDKDKNGIYNPSIDIPGVPGADQTLWFVANDLDSLQSKKLYGSSTMGVELQVTVWGYKDVEVISNMMFKKYVLINKSKNDFEETYLSVWSDPDLGDAGDDYVGCDTTLSLGYVYNGDDDDGTYGSIIPSMGFKFLQGPLVEGNSADQGKINGKVINRKKNLPMTSFSFFIGSDPVYNDPDLGKYETGTLQYYNLMQGLITTTGAPFINPLTNEVEAFTLAGDPITKEGWVDGILHPPGDRRMAMNSGPFTMAAGDTQEVIIAEIAAGGEENVDRFEAIKLLKLNNSLAQGFYSFNFNVVLPFKLTSPKVESVEMDRNIILNWYNDDNLNNIENSQQFNYTFQGYTVYQYPNSNFNNSEAKEVVTYDLNDGIAKIISGSTSFDDPSQLQQVDKLGRDSGLQRHISITKDLFNSSLPLNNGTEYFFGVSAYTINTGLEIYPKFLESVPFTVKVIPQTPKPGNFYEGTYGQNIKATQTIGNTNLDLNINIIDPTKTTGETYSIKFGINPELPDSNFQNFTLSLYDGNNNALINNEQIIIQNIFKSVMPIVKDGFEISPFNLNDLQTSNLTSGDEFTFTTPKTILENTDQAHKDVELVNVYPNPYYANNVNELYEYEKYVTFNHLPTKAIIRIFNLGGQLVTTIKKNDQSQFLRWNLTNAKNFYVPSGLFLAYIEMPELGKTKILKLAIIMETIIPDYF